MKIPISLRIVIIQPNSTANLPSQVAILDYIQHSSSKTIVIILGLPQCLSLSKLLIDTKKYTVICINRIPGFIRGLFSSFLGICSDCLGLEILNIVVSYISPSLFPRGCRTIFSGDGFGFSNLPSWNPTLVKRKRNNPLTSCQNFAPYTLTPSYEDFKNSNCSISPRLVVNNPLIHSQIVSFINALDSISKSCFGCQSADNYFGTPCTLVALSAFSQNHRITLDDEIQIVLCRLKDVAQNNSTIFLKPHPFDSDIKVKLLFGQLKDIYPVVHVVPDILPVEFLLSYAFKNFSPFKFLSFQQSALSTLLIGGDRALEALEFGFGRPLIERFWSKKDMNSRIIYENWINAAIANFSVSLD